MVYIPPKKRVRLIKITTAEIAAARGVTRRAVNRAHCRGLIDMTDLKSIARYVLKIRTVKKHTEGEPL